MLRISLTVRMCVAGNSMILVAETCPQLMLRLKTSVTNLKLYREHYAAVSLINGSAAADVGWVLFLTFDLQGHRDFRRPLPGPDGEAEQTTGHVTAWARQHSQYKSRFRYRFERSHTSGGW